MSDRARSDYVDVDEAARVLGVSRRHVARLGEMGEIYYLGRGVIERASLNDYLRERQFSRQRAWSTETAWAAVALLSGVHVDWLGKTQLSRLRGRLRDMAHSTSGSEELIGRARERAEIRAYESHDFLTSAVKKRLIVVNRRTLDLAATRRDELDGYIGLDVAAQLEKRYGLRRDSRGTMVLRVTTFDTDVIKRIASTGNGALAALDAAASQDARVHGVGLRALNHHLSDFAHGDVKQHGSR